MVAPSDSEHRVWLFICVSDVSHAAQNDGEPADGEHAATAAAANGDQKADRAKSKKREAARAAAKEAATEHERRKAELEMLMMPDAELRSVGEVSVGSCFRLPSCLEVEADPEANAVMQVAGRRSMGKAAPPTSSTSCPGRTGSSRRRHARRLRPARTAMRTSPLIQVPEHV